MPCKTISSSKQAPSGYARRGYLFIFSGGRYIRRNEILTHVKTPEKKTYH
ncbi:hypothetical protein D3OALGA1CA_1143 [Olavius algarvensis associated proteobacterium Delta 3]|nr:hypothetical protein D3OALGB2SA_1151 [Olavius algarvensis associated proteobacterium Delta 3]CAB5094960.1 hypothetical protein D3OALGA1CA_1143 [Olavius algarvensis associated proteobacterium Delta 3]